MGVWYKWTWQSYDTVHLEIFMRIFFVKNVRKKAKIRNGYNQAQHQTQDTTWESDTFVTLIIRDIGMIYHQ